MKPVFRPYHIAGIFAFFSWSIACSSLSHADFVEGDAALSSVTPHIPEPLLFDLVRPLGSQKGEMEVNVFTHQYPGKGALEWAPEIEYVFTDGYAIEFELPSENSSLEDYKVALQGTFYATPNALMVHGWQVIAKKNRDAGQYSADALYINGYRLSNAWSTLNMLGARHTGLDGNGKTTVLINNNLFYDYSQRLTYGIELNHEIDPKGQWRYRATPQIHFDFNQNITLQAGLGVSTLNEKKSVEPIFSMRLIYAL